ncbi:MAG: NUDIX domain-containing protein, partial [Candidatus Nomurabacteria bacterium]|nr:NUDIX domain-containing protein [Candidatus Nomurabacteria bacterium]
MADNLEEFLDIVDEDDVVTGSRNRNDVHIFGLLHREVHVWFFDKKNNIFFQKRGVNKSSGGLFDATVGGHVDSEEDYSTAAIREVKE